MATLPDIEQLAEHYSRDRDALAERVQELQAELERVKRAALPAIRAAVRRASQSREALRSAVEDGRELFDRPRTRIFAGVRVGLKKGKGKVEWDDEASVIERIRQRLPADQAELLIRQRESVHKPAVYDLTAADLKRLGIRITDDGDQIVVQPTDSEVDKLVDALLGAELRETEEDAA